MLKEHYVRVVGGLLLAVACATATVLVASSQRPTAGQPVGQADQPPQRAAPAQQVPSTDQRGTEQSPVVVRVLPAQKTQEEAAQLQTDREREATTNRRLVWLTGTIALFTLGLIVVGVLQWKTYSATLATNKVIERAYIDLSHVGGLEIQGESASISFHITNNGRTPGDVLGGRVWLGVSNEPGAALTALTPGPPLPPAFMNPSDAFAWGPIQLPIGNTPINPDTLVLVLGEADYRDRFDGFHQSGYARQRTDQPGNNLGFTQATAGLNYDRPMTTYQRRQYEH